MTVPPSPPAIPPPVLLRLPGGAWAAPIVQALRAGALVVRADAGVLEISGTGAVACMQGLLTSDFEKPGDGAFVYGALLTPKGMIVVDGWASRIGNTVRFTVPAAGRERALAIFTRSVPPRLARSADRSGELAVVRLVGAHALAIADAARLPTPSAPGRATTATLEGAACDIARAIDGAPFALQIIAPPGAAARLADRLVAAGALTAGPPAFELARILAGWPGLSSEVDERTLPQEVRFDEIGGVSYTKGCYTGQETVSRLHFRGHANRGLVGLEFDAEPPVGVAVTVPLRQDEREMGRVTSVAWLPEGAPTATTAGRWIGLGVLRREVEIGARVRAGEVAARVVALPFVLPRWDPA
jgi:folate-binding protein YgfZ